MARVRRLDKGRQSVTVHPTEVDYFYQVVRASDGELFLHLSTFGSDARQSGPKSSQSLQLSEEVARELVSVIRATFNY